LIDECWTYTHLELFSYDFVALEVEK